MHDDFKPLSDLHRRDLGGDAIAHWQAQFAALAAIAPERRLEARRELLPRYLAAAYEAEDSFEGLDSDLVHPQWTLDHPDARVRAAFDHIETHWHKLVKTSAGARGSRSEEHTSELQSLMRTSYA